MKKYIFFLVAAFMFLMQSCGTMEMAVDSEARYNYYIVYDNGRYLHRPCAVYVAPRPYVVYRNNPYYYRYHPSYRHRHYYNPRNYRHYHRHHRYVPYRVPKSVRRR